jgi:hypothetical protein
MAIFRLSSWPGARDVTRAFQKEPDPTPNGRLAAARLFVAVTRTLCRRRRLIAPVQRRPEIKRWA